jgi:hypothetical protein
MSKTSRREILLSGASFIGASLLLPKLSSSVVSADTQAGWRYCTKCHSLFWPGSGSDKAPCAAGGIHTAAGFIFYLPYNIPGTPKAQSNWRFCNKCFGMFWNGYPDKGRCAAGGAHRDYGYDFVLPHDIGANANNQDRWRFCDKCKAMFFDGYPDKGRCPAGGGHNAQGYMFVLPHDLQASSPPNQSDFRVRTALRTDGWAPIEGWTEITANPNGDYSFSGHIHNSGGVNIRFTLGAVLVSPSGNQYAFAVSNKRVDGFEVLIGRNRDYNWNQSANSPEVAKQWADFSKSVLGTKLVASSAVGSGLTNFLKNIVIEVYQRIPNPIMLRDGAIGLPLQILFSL